MAGSIPATIQWMKPFASGSVTSSTSSTVPAGMLAHVSGGAVPTPSQEYSVGIVAVGGEGR